MNIYSVPPLISSLLFLSLGLFCYYNSAKTKSSAAFLRMALNIAWWQGSWTILFNVHDAGFASILIKIGYSGIIFLPPTLYHFIIEFLDRKNEKKFLWLAYGAALFFLATLWTTNLFINGYYTFYWGFYPKASFIFHPVYLTLLSAQVMRVLYLLFSSYRKSQSTPMWRNQIKYLFWAIFAYSFAALDFMDNYGLELYPLGVVPVFISMCIIGYTVVKYNLWDINIVIGKGLIYLFFLMLVTVITFILIFIVNIAMHNIYSTKVIITTLFVNAFLCTVFALFYPALLTKAKIIIEDVLYKNKHKYQDKLREVARNIPTIYDMNELLKTLDSIGAALDCSPYSFMLLDNITKRYSIAYSTGLSEKVKKELMFSPEIEFIQKLKWGGRPIVKEELLKNDPARERMELIKAEVSVPIMREDTLLGVLNFNHKASGDVYSSDDLSVLRDIAEFLGMAIENITLKNKEHHAEIITYLNNIAYAMSHELKNKSQVILTTACGILNMLPSIPNVSPDLIKLAKMSQEKIAEIDKIVNEMVAYSNTQQMQGFGELNLAKTLDDSLRVTGQELEAKKIKIIKDYKEAKISHGDWGQIIQAFVNVIKNGIESMETDGSLSLKISDKDKLWEISITDTGKGIPKNHLDSIFEPFFTTKFDKTGLGLSIARRIVYDHAGDIKAESEEGKGTTVNIYLPKQMPEEKIKARSEIKRREDIAYDKIKTKDARERIKKEEQNGKA